MVTHTLNASLFNDPFFIGWDKFFKDIEHSHRNVSNFPPYNLIEMTEDTFLIELALAGFNIEDLDVSQDKNMLTIKGEIEADGQEKYIHKGIATRNFTRTFNLAEHIEVKHVTWQNGILAISLVRNVPEDKKPKTFKIKDIND